MQVVLDDQLRPPPRRERPWTVPDPGAIDLDSHHIGKETKPVSVSVSVSVSVVASVLCTVMRLTWPSRV